MIISPPALLSGVADVLSEHRSPATDNHTAADSTRLTTTANTTVITTTFCLIMPITSTLGNLGLQTRTSYLYLIFPYFLARFSE